MVLCFSGLSIPFVDIDLVCSDNDLAGTEAAQLHWNAQGSGFLVSVRCACVLNAIECNMVREECR